MESTNTPQDSVPEIKPTYQSRLGETVTVTITQHARIRFHQRWNRVFPGNPLTEPIDNHIATWFNQAKRLNPHRHKRYLRRYGKDVLYFKEQCFIFIVRDSIMITAMLGTPKTRHLNIPQMEPIKRKKLRPPSPDMTFSEFKELLHDSYHLFPSIPDPWVQDLSSEEQCIALNRGLGNSIARNTTHTDIMKELYQEHNTDDEPSMHIRTALAKNKHLPPDLLKKLIHDIEPCVRKATAHHKKLSPEFFEILANDPSDRVLAELAQNPRIPIELLDGLSQNNNLSVLKAVVNNKNATEQTLNTARQTLQALMAGEDIHLYAQIQQSLNDLYWRHKYKQPAE